MKVIDLLNKIANGDIPKKIKYGDYEWRWEEFRYINVSIPIQKLCFDYIVEQEDLNKEIEIIEEDKKIEKLNAYIYTNSLNYQTCNIMFEKTVNKINEIIDHINKE